MGGLMITAEAMQDFKSKIYGDNKKMEKFDQLLLVGAVASKKEAEIVFENSRSADEALRKLDALNIFCPRRDDDNQSENKRKKMRYSQPLELPEEFKRKIETMGGCSDEARLVIEKELYMSDVKPGASRLTMPKKQLLYPSFLEKDEVEWLEEKDGELHIKLIDPMVEEENIYLARWKYDGGCKSYVLRTRWNYIVFKNGLKFKDLVQVWSFRNKTNNKLHLVLVKRGVNSNEAGCSGSSSNASTVDDGEVVQEICIGM